MQRKKQSCTDGDARKGADRWRDTGQKVKGLKMSEKEIIFLEKKSKIHQDPIF